MKSQRISTSFIFVNIFFSFLVSIVNSVSSVPPNLLIEPESDLIVDRTLPIELPCLAQGNPTPIYTWIKDGEILRWNSNENAPSLANNSGTLVFPQIQLNDQGFYQCNASNRFGTALSRKVRLRLADLDNFPISDQPQTVQVRRGDSFVLPCRSPNGVPNPEIFWTDNQNAANRYGYIVSNPRIQQDSNGNLYFLNVKDEDGQKQFVCNVFSRKLNLIRRSAAIQLKIIPSELLNRRPTKLWATESNKIFFKGENISLKCIFAGLPTPDVLWRKTDGILPERRSIFDEKKHELILNNVQFEDSGIYQCQGQNEFGYDLHEIRVQIESKPTWKNVAKDTNVAEGETVEFLCEAEPSRPSISLQWSFNGISLQDPTIRRNSSRRRLAKNRLIIPNVTSNDIGVYQCNLSNVHGYLYANFYLNVISNKPEIQRGPEAISRFVEGQTIRLPCETFGVPKPKIQWRKRNEILSGGRYSLIEDGSLIIRDALITDTGVYFCNATNKFGYDTRNTTVNVKRKTQIQTKPTRQDIRRGSTASFRCVATTDSSLTQQIDWFKDGQLISYSGRFSKDSLDQNTLKIVNVQFDDSGIYTCRASTELDFDEAAASLLVQDRPNRPKIIKVQCNGSVTNSFGRPFANVLWESTGDNNAPIIYYELQYNTSFQPNNWISVEIDQQRESFTEVKASDGSIKLIPKTTLFKTNHLPPNQNDLQVPLACWSNFTFRIFAYNRIGASEASVVTHSMCSTEMCRPKVNPTGVKASAVPSSLFLIEWDAMPQIQWGAPKFWYEVGWRRYLIENSSESFTTQRVLPPQRQYAIPNPSMNMRYQYYVKAVNQPAGESNSSDAIEPVKYHVGFAGESPPTYIPRNFRVLRMLDSTTVEFGWDPPLSTDEVNIRGVLKGYQIEMFRLDDPENTHRIVSDILPNQTSTTVFNAPPNADVGAHICIETERYFGPTSPLIQFPTREGRPSPVTNLRGVPHSSNGIYLLWDPPEEPNGILIGYQITYNTIENLINQPGLDQPSILLRDDTRRSYLLGGLQPNRKYRVQVRAQTSVGLSTRPAIIELTTNQTLAPSKPTFVVTQRASTFFNISFDPTIMTVPGSVYYVQYKENDNDDPLAEKKTYAVSTDHTIFVNLLESGRTYVTRLVASDGIESETASDPQMITTLAKDRAPRVINSPWFIGLIVSLIVLMIVIAIVCGILKRKGGKYSVQDKEMLHGPSGYAEDEAKFSEYYRAPSDVSIKRSRTSLNNGDDRDSMAEFNDEKDRSRFQEDGSFIGQYGRDDLRRSYLIKTDEHEVLDPGKSLSNI